MSEIEVGEYVRTKEGNIFKIIGGNSDNYDIDIDYIKLENTEDEWFESNRDNDNGYFFNKRNIIKHSPNIIDLIEVGDYVNGERVIGVSNVTGWVDTRESVIHQEQIKSIVTKEMMEQIEYRIK